MTVQTVQILELAVIVGLGWLLHLSYTRAGEALNVVSDQHARDRADQLRLIADLAASTGQRDPHPDLTEAIALIDRLCQRIQAPDVAVTEHAMAQPLPAMPQPPLPDDDNQFWADQGFAPSKEELADQLMRTE